MSDSGNPALHDSQVAAALARHKAGDLVEAEKAYRKIIAANPRCADAIQYLGVIEQQRGNSSEALRLLNSALQIEPENVRALRHLAQILAAERRPTEACEALERALAISADDQDALAMLAHLYRTRGSTQEAIKLYRRVLAANPNAARTAFNLANALREEGQLDEALECFQMAGRMDPADHLSRHNEGVLLEHRGDFAGAVCAYRKALAVNAASFKSLANLLALPAHQPTPQELAAARQVLTQPGLDDKDRFKLLQALGQSADATGHYDAAFSHYFEAKKIIRRDAPPDRLAHLKDYYARIVATFQNREEFAHLRASSQQIRPVFVVGMPRSGTTLTEQILASHPQVHGAGELQTLGRITQVMSPAYPEGVKDLTPASAADMASRYITELSRGSRGGVTHAVDKQPQNFAHLGLIDALFSDALIVHCDRNPLDVGISCFMHVTNLNHGVTTDLEDFGYYFLEYRALMSHFRRLMPDRIHDLRYEAMVCDQETETRRLLEFCGLPWSDACLAFNETDRSVLTPSRWQVRQPMYATSVGRWRRYERHLQPLVRILEEGGALEKVTSPT